MCLSQQNSYISDRLTHIICHRQKKLIMRSEIPLLEYRVLLSLEKMGSDERLLHSEG